MQSLENSYEGKYWHLTATHQGWIAPATSPLMLLICCHLSFRGLGIGQVKMIVWGVPARSGPRAKQQDICQGNDSYGFGRIKDSKELCR